MGGCNWCETEEGEDCFCSVQASCKADFNGKSFPTSFCSMDTLALQTCSDKEGSIEVSVPAGNDEGVPWVGAASVLKMNLFAKVIEEDSM